MKKLLNILFILVTTFLLLEIVIRLCGVTPFRVQKFNIQSVPDFCLLPDSTYGFALNPGEYQVTMNHEIHYTCTHDEDSMRILTTSKPTNFEKTIDIHGCSFTYGMGVDDSLAFPFLLQKAFSNRRFRSFAVPGFGNVQALIRLQYQIKNKDVPNVLIVCYANFHDERNALNSQYRKSLYHGFLNANEKIQPLFHQSKMPFYTINNGLQYQDWKTIYHNWSGRNHLASINSIQDAIEIMTINDGKAETHEILLTINDLCQKNNIQFIVATLTKNDSTTITQHFCKQKNITVWDIGLDLSNTNYNNMPYDIHPNVAAHGIFGEQLMNRLK